MMRGILARGEMLAANRVAGAVRTLLALAEAELPSDLQVVGLDDGIAISGAGLARRLAFDARLRGLTITMQDSGR